MADDNAPLGWESGRDGSGDPDTAAGPRPDQRWPSARRPGARRVPSPGPAQRRLIRQVAAARKARQRRAMLAVVGAASALTLLISGGAWVLSSYVNAKIGRVNAGTSGTPSSGPINILVAGVDTRGGLTRQQELRLHVGKAISSNSDTLMLVHIPANHSSVQVVSLPRDSWVDIPGHGMNKINAAFGIGGPDLMVRTVEQATGLTINDYIEINFLGFVKVVNALGGVNVCVPYAVHDSYSGLRLTAGPHHVDGITALEFVRDRHSFAQSDLARISDQQQLLSSLFAEATSSGTLADPIKLQHVLSSVTSAVKVDEGFNLDRLAEELRGLRPSDISFTTVPLASVNYTTPTGESAVLWDKTKASALFTDLKHDVKLAKPAKSGHRSGTHARRQRVSVDVYNGTAMNGLSTTTGQKLLALGFNVHQAGLNWRQHNVRRTLIEFAPGHRADARLLRRSLPGAQLRAVSGLPRIRIILGATGSTARGAHAPAPSSSSLPPGQIAAPGSQRTAAQDACH